MNVDLSQFHQAFFEETAEHLTAMEQLLVALDIDAPDAEDLNAIFRAAHSIKGGSGIFGFTEMADVTHVLESLLDRIRSGKTAIQRAMIDVFLEACDVLAGLLQCYRSGGTPDYEQIQKCAAICVQLQKIDSKSSGRAKAAPVSKKSSNSANSSDDTFGFFDEPAISATLDDASFGFFDEPAAPTQKQQAQLADSGYGFFDDAPVTATNKTPVIAVTAIATAADASPSNIVAPLKARASERNNATAENASIRVSIEKTDQLINLVGELVITEAMLEQMGRDIDPAQGDRMQRALAQLARNTRQLQEAAMSLRMLPIGQIFSRFPRLVRDLAGKLGKDIELVIEGEGTELDKSLIEKLIDPLTHIVRNSIDHGIEAVADRNAAGKNPRGTLRLSACHRGGNIVIEVIDDGRGLDRERILAKARERGLPSNDEMSDAEVWQLIFEPGFSTAEAITDVSGRGVGMDVVRRNIGALSGRVELESWAGQGSRVTIRLPLTLAILDGMLIEVGTETYVIPLASIVESLQPVAANINSVAGHEHVVRVRGEYLPVVALHELFALEPRHSNIADAIVVLLEGADGLFALQVDALAGQSQVVIKSLENNYRRVPGFFGATILGNGRVAMILDVDALLRISRRDKVA
jgi:two-component system chemotaxis sensor kinase CheA